MHGTITKLDRIVFDIAARTAGGSEAGLGDKPALSRVGLAAVVLVAGGFYGAVMGSFNLVSWERALLIGIGATKVPLLVLVTTAVCVPAFFVLNTIAGLRDAWLQAVRCVLLSQASFCLALLSLAPVTRLIYWSGSTHRWAIVTNSCVFLVATIVAQTVLRRAYAPLIAQNKAHRVMLWAWAMLYTFVGIQMGWMLRPFVGKPSLGVSFFREGAFTNAYVELSRTIFGGA